MRVYLPEEASGTADFIEKMDKFKETRLRTQIEYIDGLINDLDKSYDDRGNDYDLHFMFGRAIGGLKGIHRTLNDIIPTIFSWFIAKSAYIKFAFSSGHGYIKLS